MKNSLLLFGFLSVLAAPAPAKPPILREDSVTSALDRGDVEAAVSLLKQDIAKQSDTNQKAELYAQIAEIYLAQGSISFSEDESLYEEALRYAEQGISLSAKSSKLWRLKGRALKELHQLRVAEEAFTRAFYYGDRRSAAEAGRLRRERSDLAGALSMLQMATEETPSDTTLWIELADVAYRAEQIDTCIEALQQVMARDPDNLRIIRFLGIVLLEQGRVEESIEVRKLWAIVDPGVDSFSNLALAFAQAEQAESAYFYYERALNEVRLLDPKIQATILNNFAWFLCTTKHPEYQSVRYRQKAYDMAKEAITLGGRKQKEHLDTFAEAAFRLGRPEEAKTYEEEAIALSNGEPFYKAQLEKFSAQSQQTLPRPGLFLRLGE
jgi:tetratricopeptide (TPR) repeat protein